MASLGIPVILMSGAATAKIAPAQLKCEYRIDPKGIDSEHPRLSWIVESSQRGERQTAYQIRVASSETALRSGQPDLWDSGEIESDETAQIEYAGRPLESEAEAWWDVRVWDKDGKASSYSAPARWTMGLLMPSDWKAKWIGEDSVPQPNDQGHVLPPAQLLRKEFALDKPIRRATLYATALGIYEARINGHRIGDEVFRPGWTDYKKRVFYQTYDVTSLLKEGANAVGAILGDGWAVGYVGLGGRERYGIKTPRLLAQISVVYEDGTRETIATDESWRTTDDGPIREGDLLMGEEYDARREKAGWDQAGFSDANWKSAHAFDAWSAQPEAYPGVPVRRTHEFKPVTMTEPKPETYVFDLGQNMVGWTRLKAKGPAGTKITLRFAEMLNPDGTIYTTNLRGARCIDTYTLKGGETEVWEPSLTFHGFRYVEITGYPGKPTKDAVTGVVVHSDMAKAGTFVCSSAMANQLQHNIEWGQRGNYLEVPTDCPQRDERLGWMGDAQAFVRTGGDNFDVSAFFTKWMIDVEDAQRGKAFTDVSPDFAIVGSGTAAWADAGIIVPWTIYHLYGDTRILSRHYAAMARYIEYMQEHSDHLLRPNEGYGDWLSINADTPRDVLATAYFAYSSKLMTEIAEVLGKKDDARGYRDLFERIKTAFDEAYVGADGRIKGDTQTCYVLALKMDLLPPEKRETALKYLVDDIEKRDGHLSTGFVGTIYLVPTLSRFGRNDAAYRLLNKDTFPSWGFEIKHGATTIWERWDGWTQDKGFQDPGMNSFNHYAFGAVGEWLYSTVAGIDGDPAHPGFKRIVIRPVPGGGLTYARATYDSIRGRIASGWEIKDGALHLDVTIPANATAEVFVPASDADQVTESGELASQAPGVKFLRQEGNSFVYEVGSGKYAFVAKGFKP